METIPTQDLNFPVVNVGSNKRPTYLPAHLCEVWPGQVSKLRLDPGETREMIKFAVRDPYENAKSIMTKAFETLGLNSANQELVTLFPFRVVRDLSELTQTEMLWTACG